MGAACKAVDAVLLVMFVLLAVVTPLIDSQIILPQSIFPDALVRLQKWYVGENDDVLMQEKPLFLLALLWLQLLFQWPLALLNIYGMLASKPWFRTTCLIFGASFITTMVAVMGELLGSPKTSDQLLMTYSPFMGFAVLAFLRGLLPQSCKPKSPNRATIKGKKSA